jgi:3,5-epimerase/4-reductase
MQIVLFGARGYLGSHFQALYPEAFASPANIADREAVRAVLDERKPDIILNCAGKTGKPNVDWCETHKEETLHGNVTGPLVLLEEAQFRGIYLVHMSSGCIYAGDNGGQGFSETDAPNFFGSFYSRTKAWSDQILAEFPVLILRLRMPFDGSASPRSLLMKLRKYQKVLDEPNSLTCIPDFLRAAEALIAKRATGIYNVVNEGVMSPLQVMEAYRDIVDPAHTFHPLTVQDLGTVVTAGRSNCRLSTAKLRGEGITMRPVEEAVRDALVSLKGNLAAEPGK